MLASLERGKELLEAGAITSVEFQALKKKLLKQGRVAPALAEAARQQRAEQSEVEELRAQERVRRASALALGRKTQAELERETAPLIEVTGWLDDWCANFDAITIGRCAHCELGTNFSRVATMARQAKARMLVAVAALEAARAERVRLDAAVHELKGMVSEQDTIVQDEQEGRMIVAQSMRETFATLAEAEAAVTALVSGPPLISFIPSHHFRGYFPRRDSSCCGVSQRATVSSQNEALQAASQRERVLQTKFSKLTEESERKESERDAKILELETQLGAVTKDWERQVRPGDTTRSVDRPLAAIHACAYSHQNE